jgi:hypothetical protein
MRFDVYHTALDVYRANRFATFDAPLHGREARLLMKDINAHATPSELSDVNLARYNAICDFPNTTVLVTDESAIRKSDDFKYRLWTGEITGDMIRIVDNDLCIPTPEFLYLLYALKLPEAKLVELGMELCGSYTVGPYYFPNGPRPAPLTTPAKLEAFIKRFPGTRGSTRAMHALKFVVKNSWSPMETKVIIIVCLPVRMGGYGAPIPVCNKWFGLSESERPYDGRTGFDGDIVWERTLPDGTKIIAIWEFDGGQHFTKDASIRDGRKDRILTSKGCIVQRVTSADVYNRKAMDLAARDLFNALQLRKRTPSHASLMMRDDLRELILPKQEFVHPDLLTPGSFPLYQAPSFVI